MQLTQVGISQHPVLPAASNAAAAAAADSAGKVSKALAGLYPPQLPRAEGTGHGIKGCVHKGPLVGTPNPRKQLRVVFSSGAARKQILCFSLRCCASQDRRPGFHVKGSPARMQRCLASRDAISPSCSRTTRTVACTSAQKVSLRPNAPSL